MAVPLTGPKRLVIVGASGMVGGYALRCALEHPAVTRITAIGRRTLGIFQPGYIYQVEPRTEPNLSYRLLRAMYPVFRVLFPNQVIRGDDLARAMVDVVVRDTSERRSVVFENRDIRAMVGSAE